MTDIIPDILHRYRTRGSTSASYSTPTGPHGCESICPRPPFLYGTNSPVADINRTIDFHRVPNGVNESIIEHLLQRWERCSKHHLPQYWLLAARILEMAMLCAGHYIDNCEFSAAGDLLFNPRKIMIYCKGDPQPVAKHRHGRLSDQLRDRMENQVRFPMWFKHHATLQTTEPAIVPYLIRRLENRQCMTPSYMQSIRRRAAKAADAIGFLAAWHVRSNEVLHGKMQTASTETRQLVSDHLCAFDASGFAHIGEEIDILCRYSRFQSTFMVRSAFDTGCGAAGQCYGSP